MTARQMLTMDSNFANFGCPPTTSTLKPLILVIFALALFESGALSQNGTSVSQVVTVEVKPISKIVVNGNPGALVVTDAVAGNELSSIDDENTKYSLTTNLDNMKIVASINERMPAGTRLFVNLRSSKGASVGTVDISNAISSVNVVTGISKTSDKDQAIKYTFAADASVGELAPQSRIITLTLTD